jgi:hypothetical protein
MVPDGGALQLGDADAIGAISCSGQQNVAEPPLLGHVIGPWGSLGLGAPLAVPLVMAQHLILVALARVLGL